MHYFENIIDKSTKEILETFSSDYYGSEYYDDSEINAVKQVITNKSPFRYYGSSPTYQVDKLEDNCKQLFNVRFAHAVNSCTGALLAALHALDIGIGDEVLIPGYFWVAMANTVVLRGAFPILCEIDDTYNLDISDFENRITDNTKCIIVAHMDGVPANMDEIMEKCKGYKIKVIEDFSQCIGGTFMGKMVGTFGDIGVASLQVNKLLTAGEGGIILTNNEDYYNKIVSRTDFGYQRKNRDVAIKQNRRYLTLGEGRRFNELSAAVMNVQIHKLDIIKKQLRETKEYIENVLQDISPIKYRKIIDKDGELCTSIFLQFPSLKMIHKFMNKYYQLFPNRNLNIYVLSEFGFHIYYNCIGLVEKVEALPGGFPWNLEDDKHKHCYSKGTLPNTDHIVEKTVVIKLPAGIGVRQREALAYFLKKMIEYTLYD